MKKLRYYFLSSLIWVTFVLVAVSSVSCSKKDNNSATNCNPYIQQCVGGVGPGIPSGSFIPQMRSPNGRITNQARFDDFNLLMFPYLSGYHCVYSSGFGNCKDIQVGIGSSSNGYGIALFSTSLANTHVGSGYPGSTILNATILSQNDSATVFEVKQGNPYPHTVATLSVSGTAASSIRQYNLYYWTGANSYLITSGYMQKGIDYQ